MKTNFHFHYGEDQGRSQNKQLIPIFVSNHNNYSY